MWSWQAAIEADQSISSYQAGLNQTAGSLPIAKLAAREQVHVRTLRWTVSRLVANGHIEIDSHKRVPWSCRPVAFYAVPKSDKSNSLNHMVWSKHGRK